MAGSEVALGQMSLKAGGEGGLIVNTASLALNDCYPRFAISTLMRIIRDPTLSQHHTSVVQAVTFIFKSRGLKAVPYISQVIPSMMTVIRTSDNAFRDFLFGQLGFLTSSMKGRFWDSVRVFHSDPNRFEISELCILGFSCAIFLRWPRDQTMKAFIGLLM